jgi:predicted ATPase/DNA-binding CsgD family transcriptional regulator
MAVDLLERDPFLLTLNDLLHQAGEGHGRVALISGEAGIGKTSLVDRFLEQHQRTTRTLWGACEALFTPRPLGPLYDIALQTQTSLRALLDSEANRATLFAAVLDELTRDPTPTIVVIEDIHWADEATLDLIKYLVRRIHRTASLLILTYRDDELTKDHPLRLVLGDLPAGNVTRVWLPPLSEIAVAVLARQGSRSARQLYAITNGNPFFLTEVLASDAPGAPPTVHDVVLARMARLSPAARSLLELIAVVPTRIEWRAIEAIGDADGATLEECLTANMLHLEDGVVGFRHELARQAVEGALSPARRRALHAQTLHALLEHGDAQVSSARLVHHASQAEDRELVLRFAPEAARQAAAQGAHREAAAHYRTALRYAKDLDDEQRGALLDGLSHECLLTGQVDEALQTSTAALAIWRALDQTERVGYTVRRLSRISWNLGHKAESERYAEEAIELLKLLPPSRELAMAYGNMSQLRMQVSDDLNALRWGERAIELAERLHDGEIVCYALISIASAEICLGDEKGQARMERGLQLALDNGYEEQVGRAYANLAGVSATQRAYAQASEYLQAGLAYCAEHDLDSIRDAMRAIQVQMLLDQGDWAGAEEGITTLLSLPKTQAAARIPELLILGMVRMRRGDPGVETVLDEARDLAALTGEMQHISPVAAVRAEWRWLQGNREACCDEAAVGFPLAVAANRPWYWGEVAIWLWRGGRMTEVPERTPAPFALQMAGDWCAAADTWEQIGCPYEQALALMGGDEAAQRQALEIFERLGARPAAELVRRQLRSAGVRGLPRGPRSTTRENPYGLTNRQLEILLLVAEGLRNPEIADRLSTTPKTVEHHVSEVLAKLSVRSRAEAVRLAYHVGLVPQAEQV